jgi:endonuclease-3
MNKTKLALVKDLIKRGTDDLRAGRRRGGFKTGIQKAEDLLDDIAKHPHVFVLGCIMDRQVRAEHAWAIPYVVGQEAGGFRFRDYLKLDKKRLRKIFQDRALHRFRVRAADSFHSALYDIQQKYDGDASRIWTGNPSSAAIIRRFLEFNGVGPKIATMATNILLRDFKVEMQDHSSIDISTDVQVKKFFIHHGLLREDASNDELTYLARELHPEYPGVFDFIAWTGGRAL